MKIRAIRVRNVRRFANRGVAIEGMNDGVNVLAAENEQGKSTCFDALHALLFQPHTATQKAVRLLRPHSGGSPRIEADIETDQGLHRVTKQYFAGREATVTDLATGRLVAQADQAEAWIAALTQGGAAGPTGLLWVRQGITDFETGGKAQQDQETEARKDALASVAGAEVEALTGGRRMAWILQKCQEELDVLVTERGQARKGGPYAEALEELEHLRADESAKEALVVALRDALDQRRVKMARRTTVLDPDAIEAQRRRRHETAEALETARAHADQVAEAIRLRELEAGRHALALESLTRYRDALTRAATGATRLADAERDQEQSAAALIPAQKAEEDAARALEKAEADLALARERQRRAEAAGHIAEARKQLQALRDRLAKAEESQGRIEALTARGQTLALPEAAVARAEGLTREISELRAQLHATAASVTVSYVDKPATRILVDDRPIEDGDILPVASARRLEIPGIATLTISAGDGGEAAPAEALQAKQAALDQCLGEFGATTLADLKERERAFRSVTDDLKVARAEHAAWAPDGLDSLRIEAARLDGLISEEDSDTPDAEQAARDLDQAGENVTQARAAAASARAQTGIKRETATKDRLVVDHQREILAEAERELGPEDQRRAEGDRLALNEQETRGTLASATRKLEALQANAPDLETAEAAAKHAASVVERSETEAAELAEEISKLTGQIEARSESAIEEALAETQDKREAAEDRVAARETEIAVLRRLKDALEDARLAAKEQYLGPVMDELRPLISLVVADANITFDDTTLVPRSLERNGQEEDVSVLSGGMREQLTVLTRLAFARLLAKNGRPVPVILDDALVYSDDDRIEKMFIALHRQARDLQIIVFSCRQRAFAELGGQSLRMTEWVTEREAS